MVPECETDWSPLRFGPPGRRRVRDPLQMPDDVSPSSLPQLAAVPEIQWTAGPRSLWHLRQRFGVTLIVDMLREARLRCYGHFLRANDVTAREIDPNLEVLELGPENARSNVA
ncbi:unnamed protein product [Heligmosomoides polygyrus]|uniref:NR LBD domain-containing protein n=1 Tax=Heligmosomoides polygyrus TaxID=6339 RepID=A0A183F352_HELPZ|nr:unnamed protein product [Heligmosomoides polygyrus]